MMTFQIYSRSKPIPGFVGIYEAHDDGTIWTVKGKTTFRILNGRKFYSLADASRWLKRNSGYISDLLKRGSNKAIGKDGKKYKVKC